MPGSREPKGVGVAADDRISRALDEVGNDVTGWARALIEDRGVRLPDDIETEVEQFTAACALLAEHLTSIATLEWAGEFAASIGRAEAWLRGLTEKAAPGWYAGACRRKVSMEGRCGADTFVVPGLTWVTCGRCGATTHAADHLETILDEARGWVARPKAIAEAIVALVDTEQSVPKVYTRIRQWAHQGDLDAVRMTRRGYVWSAQAERVVVGEEEYGYPRYRFGDVLDRVLSGDTRARLIGESERAC